jgi:sensor domain DACNV-containing protein
MTAPAYPAARVVAPKVHAHFERHVADAGGRVAAAVVPDVETVEALIEAAFWASLRREEGYIPRISLAFVSPDQTNHPLLFERALSLDPGELARVAPAVEPSGVHLAVWRMTDELCVWGTTREIPSFAVVVEVAAPGLIVVKHHRGEEAGKYTNVAVIEGDRVKVIDENATSLPDCPELLSSLLGFESPASWLDSLNVLVQLAVAIRAHRRGGALLVVPPGSDAWRQSVVHPIAYAAVPPFAELAQLCRLPVEQRREQEWQDAVRRSVEAVAGLTAVDGATVMTSDYEVLAFGVKIARKKGSPQVEHVVLTEPVEGDVPADLHPSQLGGTRHLSAAQFVQDQRDAIALVASQDGRFTVFAWSPCEDRVHAHRVETLLL